MMRIANILNLLICLWYIFSCHSSQGQLVNDDFIRGNDDVYKVRVTFFGEDHSDRFSKILFKDYLKTYLVQLKYTHLAVEMLPATSKSESILAGGNKKEIGDLIKEEWGYDYLAYADIFVEAQNMGIVIIPIDDPDRLKFKTLPMNDEYEKRNQFMAEKISALLEEQNTKVAVLAGGLHILSHPELPGAPTLPKRLKNIKNIDSVVFYIPFEGRWSDSYRNEKSLFWDKYKSMKGEYIYDICPAIIEPSKLGFSEKYLGIDFLLMRPKSEKETYDSDECSNM